MGAAADDVVMKMYGQEMTKAETLSAIRNKNSEVLKQITTQDFQDGGRLNRRQFAEFMLGVINDTNVMDRVSTVPLQGPEAEAPNLGVGEHLLRPIGEGEYTTIHGVETGKRDFDVSKTGFGWELTRETVEDSIEQERTAEHILDQFTSQYAFDIETLAFGGDETYTNIDDAEEEAFWSQEDGWVTIAENENAPTVDGAADPINPDMLFGATYAVDEKYLDASSPAFFAHPKQGTRLRQSLSDRNTQLGDSMLQTTEIPTPTGHPMVLTPAMPADQILFTDPENLAFGVHRNMTVDSTTESEAVVMRDLYAQYNITSRIDFQIMRPEMVSLIDNIEDPATGYTAYTVS